MCRQMMRGGRLPNTKYELVKYLLSQSVTVDDRVRLLLWESEDMAAAVSAAAASGSGT